MVSNMNSERGNGVVEAAFPTGALVPKAETNVLSFLQKYPEYDGRDVTIAIMDSGVDPRASGLETLCDGKTVKVIERYDCSGSGDVDTSKKVTATDGYITGLSGRKLKLTPEMIESNNCDGEYHLGLKSFNDTAPKSVTDTRVNTIKTKHWDGPNKTAIADVLRKISEFEAQNPDSSKLAWDKKLIKENLENTLDMLNSYEKMYADIRTSYDCIVYSTENGWQTVIDTTEKGDLEKAVHLGEYAKTYETKNIDDYLSVSVNVHDDGNVLEIVGMCSAHGTHVASIASGNHASRDVDGVAPNAKIVSLTIGDGRLGSMETGTALVRAMMKIMEMCREGRKVDVINMSYGEHAHWSNAGPLSGNKKRRRQSALCLSRIGELMNEIVNKYGVVWVASAGNHGPALCTVGTPPDISQPSLIGVGAYVSPQMMEAEYAMREKLPANVYTWTSRDPCIDGGQGVTICAPGAAITSVPHFTMSKSRHMNGTSMAAPHTAGAIALLISGLKQRGIDYSPYSIKRAISVTATKLCYIDPFAQGHGLLNVEKAFEHMLQHANAPENMLRFSVRVGPTNAKGIHLRVGHLERPYEYNVDIQPVYLNEKEAAPEDKINYNVRLQLIPSTTFVQCGAFLDLCYATRTVTVKVNPVGLQAGVHTAVIRAFDTDCICKGALFEIPITVVQPHVLNTGSGSKANIFEPLSASTDGSIEFQPSTIQRNFILVPKEATWAVLRMRCTDVNRDKDVGRFFVHTVQILPKKSCRCLELQKIISVNSETDSTCSFAVQGNNILELCIAKYWSNYGTTHIKYSLEFHGIQATNSSLMLAAEGIHTMTVTALGVEDIQPQIQLKQATVALKPIETKVTPLSAKRDVIPEGRQIYQNVLTYTFSVVKAGEVCLYVPLLNSLLYESEYESQLWLLFDCNKSLVVCGDAHSNKFFTKLEKGDYTVKLQVRHEKREFLEKLNEATMLLGYKLSNSLNLDIYEHYNQCIVQGRKFTSCILKEGQPKVLYVAPLPQEKVTKANLPPNCSWLNGTLMFAKDEIGRRVTDGCEFRYVFSPSDAAKKNGNNNGASSNTAAATNTAAQPAAAVNTSQKSKAVATNNTLSAAGGDGQLTVTPASINTNNTCSPKKAKSTNDDYIEGLRDFQCSMITKCDAEKAEKIYNEVIAANPTHLPAHLLLIQNIESNNLKAQFPLSFLKAIECDETTNEDDKKVKDDKMRASLQRIVQLADCVLNDINKSNLLSYYGMKTDTRPDAAKIKTNMDKQKANLLEALVKKGIALTKLTILNNEDKEKCLEQLNAIYSDAIQFADPLDSKIIQLSLWHAYVHSHYGRMYKALQKVYEDKRTRECFEELQLITETLDYQHLQTVVQRLAISAFPNAYRPF